MLLRPVLTPRHTEENKRHLVSSSRRLSTLVRSIVQQPHESAQCVPLPMADPEDTTAVAAAAAGLRAPASDAGSDSEESDSPPPRPTSGDPAELLLWAAETNELALAEELLSAARAASAETDAAHGDAAAATDAKAAATADGLTLAACTDSDGYTPLHRAAYNGHGDMVSLLLAKCVIYE